MIASRSIAACALMLATSLTVGDAGRAEDEPRSFTGLKQEHEKRDELLRHRMEQAKTDAERAAIQAEIWKEVKSAANRAFAWSDLHPNDPEAIDAIVWTVHGLANGYYDEKADETTHAYELLTARAIASEKVAPVCYYAAGAGLWCPAAKRFLETALRDSPNRLVRGAACLGLARDFHGMARTARRAKDPITRGPLEKRWGAGQIERIDRLDPDELDRQAETYFERLIDEFGDLTMPHPYNETPFAELARGELYELRFLGVGKVMPNLKGEDVRGQNLRLNDYRGKVVAVVFWATWCGPCMEMVPHERDLVKRLKDKPFVLLGVNGDDDRDKAVKMMTKEAMTWPSLWNGGMTGGFVEKLGVRSWPTIYVLDAKGIIRYKNVRGKDLDAAVDRLMSEPGGIS